MGRRWPVMAAALGCLVLSGCNAGSREAMIKQQLSTLNEMVDMWSQIKDTKTAQAAGPRLKLLTDRINQLSEKLMAKQSPKQAVSTALHKEFDEEIDFTHRRILKEQERLQDIEMTDQEAQTIKDTITRYREPPFEMYLRPMVQRR